VGDVQRDPADTLVSNGDHEAVGERWNLFHDLERS
jgi:hypothetical protein